MHENVVPDINKQQTYYVDVDVYKIVDMQSSPCMVDVNQVGEVASRSANKDKDLEHTDLRCQLS